MKRTTVLVLALVLAQLHRSRHFLYGLYQSILPTLLYYLKQRITNTTLLDQLNLTKEHVPNPWDKELSEVWWSQATPTTSATTSKHLFIVLPGGMRTGDATYNEQMIVQAQLFGPHPFCIFHNPGIVNQSIAKAPCGLTDTTYLEHFIHLCHGRGYTTSVVGFSAGAMLAIQIAAQMADQLECAIAIHGPDRIRDVMQYHQKTWCRLDIFFAYSLATTMIGSGCTLFLAPGKGGGMERLWAPWRTGWSWMRAYTQEIFQQAWPSMEAEHWSCVGAMQAPLACPTCRVLSRNDPVVPFATIDPALFVNLDVVMVEPYGGHCGCFYHDLSNDGGRLTWRLKQWYEKIFERNRVVARGSR